MGIALGVGSPVVVTPSVIPTGGGISLDFQPYATTGAVLLQRATSGASGLSAWTQLYSGDFQCIFIDMGDELPTPLASGSQYVYQYTDPYGNVTQTPPLTPAGAIQIEDDGLTRLIIRILQAGLDNLALPGNVGKIDVRQEMNTQNFPVMPFVVVNLDLLQQSDIPIGQQVQDPNQQGIWTVAGLAKRIWRVSTFCRTAEERDYYRSAIIAIFEASLFQPLGPIGQNMKHTYQASSGQEAQDSKLQIPGYFYSDIMIDVVGQLNLAIVAPYGIISTIGITGVVTGVGTSGFDAVIAEVPNLYTSIEG